jgi:hypothetical protein
MELILFPPSFLSLTKLQNLNEPAKQGFQLTESTCHDLLLSYFDPAREDTRHYSALRDAAAAVFIFFSAAAGTRFVTANLGQ